MRFSVVTPVREALPALRRCVGSVRGQAGVEVEHIVRDAASADGTAQWLATQPDLRWRSEPDGGMYDAIQRGWATATGDVLSWLNADEQYLPGALAQVARAFEEHPDADAVFGDHFICDAATGAPLAARREIPLRRLYVANGPLYAASCTLFFRRALYDRGLLALDTSLRVVGDADLALRLLDAGVRFRHLPVYLALFGATGANLSGCARGQGELRAFFLRHALPGGRLTRRLLRNLRGLEKLLRGCYRRQTVSYDFVTDETGARQCIHAARLGTRWRLE